MLCFIFSEIKFLIGAMKNLNAIFITLFVLSFTYFISQFYRSSLGILSNEISIEYNLNSEQIGRLGGIFFLSFALVQIPIGILLDRFNAKSIIVGLLIVIYCGTLIFPVAMNYNTLLLARTLQGIGCAVCLMGPLVIISKLAPKNKFALYSGIVMGVGGLGGLVATYPFNFLIEIHGWRKSFLLTSFLILLNIITIILCSKRIPLKSANNISLNLQAFANIIKNRNFLYMLPMSVFGYSSFAFLLTLWGSKYLSIVQSYDSNFISISLMIMALSWTIGSISFGFLENKFKKKKVIILTSAVLLAFLIFILSFLEGVGKEIMLVIFLLIGFTGAFTLVLISHYRALFDAKIIGKVLTTANLFNFSGVFFVQWLIGFILYKLESYFELSSKTNFAIAFSCVPLFLIISCYFYMKTNEK